MLYLRKQLYSSVELVSGTVGDSFLVRPSRKLTGGNVTDPIPASKLTLSQTDNGHFVSGAVPESDQPWVFNQVNTLQESMKAKCKRKLDATVCKCDADIVDKRAKLLDSILRTEAEVRYAIGDPIMEMICNFWGHKVNPNQKNCHYEKFALNT